MSDLVIGVRDSVGARRNFIRGGPPERPGWTTDPGQALRFSTVDEAKEYIEAMVVGSYVNLGKYRVFQIGPDGMPAPV